MSQTWKDKFLGYRQPALDENTEDLAILILDLMMSSTVKTIYCFGFLSSLKLLVSSLQMLHTDLLVRNYLFGIRAVFLIIKEKEMSRYRIV